MIRDDAKYALEEAFQQVQDFFGTPESQGDKTPLEYEEDKRLKEVAFKGLLEAYLKVFLAWTDEEVEA